MASLTNRFTQIKTDVTKIKNALSVVAAVPRLYRERITPRQAEEKVRWLLETRVERFLELARVQIYERPDSPYLKLLNHAGCNFPTYTRKSCATDLRKL